MKKVVAIIGARPQFIKHYGIEHAAKGKVEIVTIHTGQHYDENMSQIFFDEMDMPRPGYMLQIGSGSHGAQTGKMMIEIEEVVLKEDPDYVLVYGDTNSTLAGALVAAKLHIPIIHVEAGLRSYNKEMPEEVNRVLTDHISSLLFVPSEVAVEALTKEGITQNVIVVGDIMKDLIKYCQEKDLVKSPEEEEEYYYVTLHRPYNTDEKERLALVLKHLNELDRKAIFAIHPRTRAAMKRFNMKESAYANIKFIDPQGYFDNLGYLSYSSGLITDSGGMQKEAYWLQKKCATIRTETEWVETQEGGWNHLLFEDLTSLRSIMQDKPENWDEALYGAGNAGEKMISYIN